MDTVIADGMRIAREVDVPMRDGIRLKADIFLPQPGTTVPALLSMGPYQKDKLWEPPPDLEEPANPYMNWETVNPLWWTAQGYACMRIDTRGTGKSPGRTALGRRQHAEDFYDAIEWAAVQPWCSGRIGTIGISWFAISQWHVANLNPPSLKAMIPWEGAADRYRDARFHGGLFCQNYTSTWYTTHLAHHLIGRASREDSDLDDRFPANFIRDIVSHSLDDGWWAPEQADWHSLKIPFLSAGNWSGMGLHLRGNIEAFANAVNAPRKLRMHAGTHYHPFYENESKKEQLRFFDHWLKDIQNGVMEEPPIKLGVRQGGGKVVFRHEHEWPLARTQWTRMHLSLAPGAASGEPSGDLVGTPPAQAQSVTYSASGSSRAGRASASSTSVTDGKLDSSGIYLLSAPLPQETEITGPLALRLWVSSSSEDMDLFITLRHLDEQGRDIFEIGQQGYPVPVAKGWLRVSHRELDPDKTLPYRPYHLHQRRLYLQPGEIVPVDVEIWPTSIVIGKGHRIRLDIQPRDGIGCGAFTHYVADYNDGNNTIYAGGAYDSYLLLPLIAPQG